MYDNNHAVFNFLHTPGTKLWSKSKTTRTILRKQTSLTSYIARFLGFTKVIIKVDLVGDCINTTKKCVDSHPLIRSQIRRKKTPSIFHMYTQTVQYEVRYIS